MSEIENLWFKRYQRVGYAFKTNNEAGLNLWLDDIKTETDKLKEKADKFDKYIAMSWFSEEHSPKPSEIRGKSILAPIIEATEKLEAIRGWFVMKAPPVIEGSLWDELGTLLGVMDDD